MTWTTTHTTKVTLDGEEFELELELEIAPAEPDVGISSTWINNWSIISANGNTDQEACVALEQRILDQLGDEGFIYQLEDEGATEPDYDDEPYSIGDEPY